MTAFNFGAMISQENQIKQIPIDMLVPFHNHQFTLYEGERRDDMVQSIQQNGVMTPIICRPHKDEIGKYEILIGHNRWNCSRLAGLDYVPSIIKENLTDEEAQTYVDESNLLQRGFGDLKISEQARVISRRYSEMFSQGKRNDIINEIRVLNGEAPASEQESGNSREKVGEEYGLSRNTVARLIRISKLIDGLLTWVDKKYISIRAGVELSYLTKEAQELLFDFNSTDDAELIYKISEGQARDLRVMETDCLRLKDKLNRTIIERILKKEKKPTVKKVSLNPELYTKYFSEKTPDEAQEIVEQALQAYFNDND